MYLSVCLSVYEWDLILQHVQQDFSLYAEALQNRLAPNCRLTKSVNMCGA